MPNARCYNGGNLRNALAPPQGTQDDCALPVKAPFLPPVDCLRVFFIFDPKVCRDD